MVSNQKLVDLNILEMKKLYIILKHFISNMDEKICLLIAAKFDDDKWKQDKNINMLI